MLRDPVNVFFEWSLLLISEGVTPTVSSNSTWFVTLHCDLGALLVLCDTVNVVFRVWSVLLISEGVTSTVSSNSTWFVICDLNA